VRPGAPGAIVATVNLVRVRPACTTTASTLELIKEGQLRSPRFPLPQEPQRQLLDVVNATFRVRGACCCCCCFWSALAATFCDAAVAVRLQ
jgi:hypothetical protein